MRSASRPRNRELGWALDCGYSSNAKNSTIHTSQSLGQDRNASQHRRDSNGGAVVDMYCICSCLLAGNLANSIGQ